MVLVDLGVCIVMSGVTYLRFLVEHRPIHWPEIAAEGFIPGTAIFGVHLWVRRVLSERNAK